MVRYRVVDDDDGMFRVDAVTGQIVIARPLDYDTTNAYVVRVEARDLAAVAPRSATATLNIQLTDVNDNVPAFPRAEYHAYLQENAPAGTPVTRLQAVDADSARFARVLYTLTDAAGMGQHFGLAETTGVVTSRRVFDYEKESEYRMEVRKKEILTVLFKAIKKESIKLAKLNS